MLTQMEVYNNHARLTAELKLVIENWINQRIGREDVGKIFPAFASKGDLINGVVKSASDVVVKGDDKELRAKVEKEIQREISIGERIREEQQLESSHLSFRRDEEEGRQRAARVSVPKELSEADAQVAADLMTYVLQSKYSDAKPITPAEAKIFLDGIGVDVKESKLEDNKYIESAGLGAEQVGDKWVAKIKPVDVRFRSGAFDTESKLFEESGDDFNKKVFANLEHIEKESKILCDLALPIIGDKVRKVVIHSDVSEGMKNTEPYIKILNNSPAMSVGFTTMVVKSEDGTKPLRIHYLWSHENREGLIIRPTGGEIDSELKEKLAKAGHTYVSASDKDAEQVTKAWMDKNFKDNPLDLNFAFTIRNQYSEFEKIEADKQIDFFIDARKNSSPIDSLLNRGDLKSKAVFPAVITNDQSRAI